MNEDKDFKDKFERVCKIIFLTMLGTSIAFLLFCLYWFIEFYMNEQYFKMYGI